MSYFDGICTGQCENCILKLNRKSDYESKEDFLDDDNIFYELDAIKMLNVNWCKRRYCNFDGCTSNMLLDIKNKRKRDGSGEKFTKYRHDLGLIISSNEIESMSNFKTMLMMTYGFIIYYFEDGMYAAEISEIKRHHTPAPSKDREIYYVDFDCWHLISNYHELIEIGHKANKYSEFICLECKQPAYSIYHNNCYIKNLKRRLLASQNN